MVRNCPSRFARAELEILRPGVVVAMGGDTWDALRTLTPAQFAWSESGRFHRGTAVLDTGNIELMWLNHPSSRGSEWSEGQAALVASLRETPLGSGGVSAA
jgi:uracil-DNA glycosylase